MTKKEFAEIIYNGLKTFYEDGFESLDELIGVFLNEENMWKIYTVIDGTEPLED